MRKTPLLVLGIILLVELACGVAARFVSQPVVLAILSGLSIGSALSLPAAALYLFSDTLQGARRNAFIILTISIGLLNIFPNLHFGSPPLAEVLPSGIGKLLMSLRAFFAAFFPDVYFSILPGTVLVGASLFFYDRLSSKEKKYYSSADVVWVTVAIAFLGLFVVAYSAGPDSFFLSAYPFEAFNALIPGLGDLSPQLQVFVLWIALFMAIVSAIFLFGSASRLGFDRVRIGALMIGILVAFTFAVLFVRLPFFVQIEEFFVSSLFTGSRNPGTVLHSSGEPFCKRPFDDEGKPVLTGAPLPSGLRPDIEIVGVSKATIERKDCDLNRPVGKGEKCDRTPPGAPKKTAGWPLNWEHYAALTDRMSHATNSIVLFDISFMDYKKVFGCDDDQFQCVSKEGRPMRRQTDVLADSIRRAKNIVVTDYPMEKTDEAKKEIDDLDRRAGILKRTMRIPPENIKNGHLVNPWASFAQPPIAPIGEAVRGAGFANVEKNKWGLNRRMPLVNRLRNVEREKQPGYDASKHDEFYPGIDLVIAALYYGVNPRTNVEIDFLRGYIKIKDIPLKKTIRLDPEAFQRGENPNKEVDIITPPPAPGAPREVLIPIDQHGFININFRGGFYCYKFHELLDISRMAPEDVTGNFKNKIVLVAMYYATGVGAAKDMHLSPYGDMAGIEHHAYALNTILNQDYLRDVPPVVNLLILVVIGVIMGLYQPRVPTWMSFVLLAVIAGVFVGVTSFVTFQQYSYLSIFPTVIIQQFTIAIGFIGFRALTEEENVKFIRNTFSKFVSQDVVDELLSNPEAIALGGAKKEVSVFFSDVRGFTTISEKLGPEELVKLLNEYLSVMTELIIDYRGTIDKYMGDAIMAFWGAPVQNDDHAYYACVAALAQIKALYVLQVDWSQRGIPVLDIGVGINSGQALGDIGDSSHRMDYTLMGDTVNLGSRLEGITKTYGVKSCISEFTYERVKDRVYARELDLVRVKGKLKPVRIYELMGLVNEADIDVLKRSHGKKTAAAAS